MNVFAESEHYIAIRAPGGNEGHNDFKEAVTAQLRLCDQLREEGFRPLHYLPRFSVWVCEKPNEDLAYLEHKIKMLERKEEQNAA